ncbi:MAG: zinc-ribbon domain-containing protein [Anaerolineae bacterium]|nr:zinc-ribbon domain-containing protein [Anaerolineae bacterium]
MTIGSVLLGGALLLLVALYVLWPLLHRTPTTPAPRSSHQRLLAQKEALLAEISALDFDYETGKLPAELYQLQRPAMVAEAAAVWQQMESLPPVETADEAIEAAIAQLRGRMPTAQAVSAPAVPVARGGNGYGRFCTQCGSAIDPDDRFCTHCGYKLSNRLEEETGNVPEKSVEY